MKVLITAMLFILSFSSRAEIIECNFTEPFVDFTYDTAKETLIETENVMSKTRVLKDISFQIKYAGTFLLKDSSGKLIAELKLNNQGSDGMSDAIYPYDAKYLNALNVKDSVLFGGCTSTLKPMVKKAL